MIQFTLEVRMTNPTPEQVKELESKMKLAGRSLLQEGREVVLFSDTFMDGMKGYHIEGNS